MTQPPPPRTPLDPLPQVKSFDEVVATLDAVIDWSIKAGSPIGYFPPLYKLATLAIQDAVRKGKFSNGKRLERFDLFFAQRYFDALNAYFHPRDYETPSYVWQVALKGCEEDEPLILQQMLAGLNAHINLDLAIAAVEVGRTDMKDLEGDFNLVNGLLASQVDPVLAVLDKQSPRMRLIRDLVPNESLVINYILKRLRSVAWTFAQLLALQPTRAKALIATHDVWAAALGNCYLRPDQKVEGIIEWIAEKEDRDVSANVAALAKVSSTPAELNKQFL